MNFTDVAYGLAFYTNIVLFCLEVRMLDSIQVLDATKRNKVFNYNHPWLDMLAYNNTL
jgi:hypothetical protein